MTCTGMPRLKLPNGSVAHAKKTIDVQVGVKHGSGEPFAESSLYPDEPTSSVRPTWPEFRHYFFPVSFLGFEWISSANCMQVRRSR